MAYNPTLYNPYGYQQPDIYRFGADGCQDHYRKRSR